MFAQQYVFAYLPGMYIIGLGDCQQRLLSNFGKNRISLVCTVVGLGVHFLFSWLFVSKAQLALMGTGIASGLTYTVIGLILYVYTCSQKELELTR